MTTEEQTTSGGGGGGGSNIPVSEVYWSLVEKADKKFSKIRDPPYYERNRYDTYFYKVFKVYTQLWKFQQENRQKLVEAGLKRWEIGEIASRIAQLYYGQYMRTSDASYLLESYVFCEAILSREYFKEGLLQDLNLANKQLRFLARFLMDADFKEWKLVVQEIIRFSKSDTAFMNIRPLRYSLVLDPYPDSLPHIATKRNLRLCDAILSSYHHNEIKFSELSLDTFRMLQCLEWEPSGSFYQSDSKISQNGGPGPSCVNYSQEIADPTLTPNPGKAVLYRPSVTHFLAVLGTMCEELPLDGILLIYLSASARAGHTIASPLAVETLANPTESISRNYQSNSMHSDAASTSPFSLPSDSSNTSACRSKGDCLHFGTRGNGGLNCIYPTDLIPFIRRPLFIIIDSDGSEAFKTINGSEKGEPAAILLSPSCSIPLPTTDSMRHQSGSVFTNFLTAPLQAFCLLLGLSGSDVELDTYKEADNLLSSSLADWGSALATSDTLDPVWAQSLGDPFLRRLLLRFIFCQAVLTLYEVSFGKTEFHPECVPALPTSPLPTAASSQTVILQLSNILGATKKFIFSEGIVLPECRDNGVDMAPSSLSS